jgi:ankyrin repeat protein
VFNRPEKDFNVDEKNESGESALHICARRGDALRVELLVEYGADLALRNNKGDSILHVVVKKSGQESTKETFLEVDFFLACLLLTAQSD